MAIKGRDTVDPIHHSDKGIQYCSHGYVNLLNSHSIAISMAAKGNPYDNALIESFLKTLKAEEVYLWEYETYDDVIDRIPYFIEDVYNTKDSILHLAICHLRNLRIYLLKINPVSLL